MPFPGYLVHTATKNGLELSVWTVSHNSCLRLFCFINFIKRKYCFHIFNMQCLQRKIRHVVHLREIVLVARIQQFVSESQKRFETYLFQFQETNLIEEGKTINIHFDGRLLSAGFSTMKDKVL